MSFFLLVVVIYADAFSFFNFLLVLHILLSNSYVIIRVPYTQPKKYFLLSPVSQSLSHNYKERM